MLSSTVARAATETCDDVLSKCNDALNAEIDLNKSLTDVNNDQAALITVLNTKVSQEEIWKPIAIGAGAAVILETIIIILRK